MIKATKCTFFCFCSREDFSFDFRFLQQVWFSWMWPIRTFPSHGGWWACLKSGSLSIGFLLHVSGGKPAGFCGSFGDIWWVETVNGLQLSSNPDIQILMRVYWGCNVVILTYPNLWSWLHNGTQNRKQWAATLGFSPAIGGQFCQGDSDGRVHGQGSLCCLWGLQLSFFFCRNPFVRFTKKRPQVVPASGMVMMWHCCYRPLEKRDVDAIWQPF